MFNAVERARNLHKIPDPEEGSRNMDITGPAQEAVQQLKSDLRAAEVLETEPAAKHEVCQALQGLIDQVVQLQEEMSIKTERLRCPYVISPELHDILETAEFLGKPVLLEGEPGCGKTQLAYALAVEKNTVLAEIACHSGMDPEDIMYSFDDVARLQDALLGKKLTDEKYVKLGPIGKAFMADSQIIVLIDEIDKMKEGTENRLLRVLEDWMMTVPQLGKTLKAKHKPIVIVTSNGARELSDAFRRRCVFTKLEFPNEEQMTAIVRSRFPDINANFLQSALNRFYEIRRTPEVKKQPSTAEFLDWIAILLKHGVVDLEGQLPKLQVLLKTSEDQKLFSGDLSREQQLIQLGMPQEVVSKVCAGGRVVKLKDAWQLKDKLYTTLADNHVAFQTPVDSYDNARQRRPFAITAAGVVNIGEGGWLSVPEKIFTLLHEGGFIESEVVISPVGQGSFSKVTNANRLFTAGTVDNGEQVFRMGDKMIRYSKEVQKSSEGAEA